MTARLHRNYRNICVAGCLALTVLGSSAVNANGTVTYTYDALGRISSANFGNGFVVTYFYDAAGNRTSQVVTGSSSVLTWTATSSGPCTANCWGWSNWGP